MSTNNKLLKKYQQVVVNENITPDDEDQHAIEPLRDQDGRHSFNKIVIKSHYGNQSLPIIEHWQDGDTLYLSV